MLTQQSPSAITTKMLCPACGSYLRLAVVEPHYNGKRLDNHIFACSKCDEVQTYAFDRIQASRAGTRCKVCYDPPERRMDITIVDFPRQQQSG